MKQKKVVTVKQMELYFCLSITSVNQTSFLPPESPIVGVSSISISISSSSSSSSKTFIISCTWKKKNEYLTSRLCGKINTETVNSERLELMKRLCYYRLRASTLGPHQPPIQRGPFPWRQSDQSSTLTIHLHLVPKVDKGRMEVYFQKKAKAPYQSFTFKQIYEYGVNVDTGTDTAMDEKALLLLYYYYSIVSIIIIIIIIIIVIIITTTIITCC